MRSKNNKTKARRPRDPLGSRLGTIASRVNQAVTKNWKTDEQIAKEARLKLRKARARLYHGSQVGLYERVRVIHYRLKPAELASA